MIEMDSEYKKAIIRNFKNLFSGTFGLIFYIFILYDVISIILSTCYLIIGLSYFIYFIYFHPNTSLYESPSALIARAIIFSFLGALMLIFFYLLPKYPFALLLAVWVWAFAGEKIWFYIDQKRGP